MSAVAAEPEALAELARRLRNQSTDHERLMRAFERDYCAGCAPNGGGGGSWGSSDVERTLRLLRDIMRAYADLAEFVGRTGYDIALADDLLARIWPAKSGVGAVLGAKGTISGTYTTQKFGEIARRARSVSITSPFNADKRTRTVNSTARPNQEAIALKAKATLAGVSRTWQTGTSARAEATVAGVEVSATAAAGVRLDASGSVSVSSDGLKVQGNTKVSVGAWAAVAAAFGNELFGAGASAEAFAGARAKAHGSLEFSTDGIEGEAGGEVLLGAEITGQASATVAGVTSTGHAGLTAGLSAEFEAEMSASLEKVHMSFNVGVALGLGGSVGFDIDVKPKDVVKSAGKLAGGAVDLGKKILRTPW